jgi:membrane protease YdiL (CAAX protease family)
MINEEMSASKIEQPHPTTNWWDLPLYLVVGIGLFGAASVVAVLLFEERPLLLTGAALTANFITLTATFLLLGIWRGKVSWAQMGLWPFRWHWSWPFLAVGLTIVFIPLRAALGLLIELILAGNLDSLEARSDLLMGGGISWSGFLITLIGAGLLVPIAEELFFRGLLHNWFRERLPLWPAALASSALFGLAHFDSVGVVAASFVMGLVCAIAYEQTRSILLPIGIHATTNSAAVILLYGAMWLTERLPAV